MVYELCNLYILMSSLFLKDRLCIETHEHESRIDNHIFQWDSMFKKPESSAFKTYMHLSMHKHMLHRSEDC